MDRKRIMAGVALLAVAGASAAAERGFYFAAGIGQADQDISASDGIVVGFGSPVGNIIMLVRPNSVSVDDDELGWSGTVGYRINQYVAAELSYMDLGEADVAESYSVNSPAPFPPTPISITRRYSVGVRGPAVSALGSLPLGGGFDVFLRGGVLFADQEITMNAVNSQSMTFGDEIWLAGAGVDWSFANRWSARLEYMRTGEMDANFTTGESKVSQFALGVLFRL